MVGWRNQREFQGKGTEWVKRAQLLQVMGVMGCLGTEGETGVRVARMYHTLFLPSRRLEEAQYEGKVGFSF